LTIVEKEEDKVLDSCYKINPKNPTEWIQIANLTRVRSFLTLASYKDKFIYAFGGLYMTSKTGFDSIQEIDKYSIDENKWTSVVYKGKKFYEPCQKMGAVSVEEANKIIIFGGIRIKQYYVGLTQEYEYDCVADEISAKSMKIPHSEPFMDKNEVRFGDKIYILASRKRNTVLTYDIHKGIWEIPQESLSIKKPVN